MALTITRRTALAALGSAMLATTVRAADLQRVRVSIIPITDLTPLFVGMHRGFFRDEGLEIDTSPSSGGATGIPGLVAGSYDIAFSNVVSMLLAASQGIDVRVIAAGVKTVKEEDDFTGIVVRKDSGIRSGKDLEGKSVAVNTRNNVIWLYARAWIKATGGDPDRVTYKEVPHPQMEDAITRKQVDAGFMVPPFIGVATAKGEVEAIAKPYSVVQPGLDVGEYLATATFLKSNAATVDKFTKALRRSVEWCNANLSNPEVLPIMAGFTRLDVAVLKDTPLKSFPLRVDPPQLEKTMNLMVENKLLRSPLDVKPLIAPAALQ
ncbi:ABC transporter substrate-binding protein [Bradyrhizobium sp.]|uniref:ABC transporter substrate-binding protein n=1 Tax=Bradyrhizobium sp. TaxID=376 RepID=UPI0039E4A0AB